MTFKSIVIRGSGKGNQLGFATANLKIPDDFALKQGVYAVIAKFDAKAYKGVLHFGPKPVFKDTANSLEVHILLFKDCLYDKELKITIVERLRDIKNFKTEKLLTKQIKRDCKKTENIVF